MHLCGVNIPVLLTIFIIILLLLSANGSVLTVVIILTFVLVLIGTAGTTLFIINYTKLWFTVKEIKGRKHRDVISTREVLVRGLLRVLLSYLYLVLLTYHLTASLIKVGINDKCIEDAKGKRSAWLVVQSILEVFELVLVLQCLVSHIPQRIKTLFKRTVTQHKIMQLTRNKTLKGHPTECDLLMFSSLVQTKSEVVTEVINKLMSDYSSNSISEINKTKMQFTSKVEPQKASETYGCVSLPVPKQVEHMSPATCSVVEYEHLTHSYDMHHSDKREAGLQWHYSANLLDTTDKSYHSCRSDDFSTLFIEFNCEPVSGRIPLLTSHGKSILYPQGNLCKLLHLWLT